tara:strand:+ start:400 stop:936 length:537 start_codon:yes stop_codon:yes gene_type:complete
VANFNVNDFISEVQARGGLARPTKYQIIMTKSVIEPNGNRLPPPNTLFCHAASLPGRTIEAGTYDVGYGQEYQAPLKNTMEPVDFSFYITNKSWYERTYFETWMENVVGLDSQYVSYKEDYVADIVIRCFDERHNNNYGVVLKNAFPLSINELELSGESHEPLSVTVNIAYDRWIREK